MTIGINGNEANVAHRVGVNQYAFELLNHFPKDAKDEVIVYLSNPPLSDMPDLNYQVFGPKKLWTLTGLQKKLLSDPPDVLFTPTHYTPIFVSCPSVIAIMDLAFEKFPQYFKARDLYQLRYLTRYSVKQAAKILTISEYSKKDICEIYKVRPDKVIVTYPSYDKERFHPRIKNKELRIKQLGVKQPYILFLGTLQPRKNLERLIEAHSGLETDCKLVIAGMINEGRGGWMNENIFQAVSGKRLADRVIFTGYLPDDELPGLYAGAKAFVLPSLYEGFGIPAIEAMACGTPVVVSQVSSLPEVCGQAAIYIKDPYSMESIREALKKVLTMSLTEKNRRVSLGLEWVKRYNWEVAAKVTLEVLEEAGQLK